jgi:hypothetical protein
MGAGKQGFFLLLKSVHEYERRFSILRAAEKNGELTDDKEPKTTAYMANHDRKMWLHMTGKLHESTGCGYGHGRDRKLNRKLRRR